MVSPNSNVSILLEMLMRSLLKCNNYIKVSYCLITLYSAQTVDLCRKLHICKKHLFTKTFLSQVISIKLGHFVVVNLYRGFSMGFTAVILTSSLCTQPVYNGSEKRKNTAINSFRNEALVTKVRTSATLVALRRLTSPRCSAASLHLGNHSLPGTRRELLKAARKERKTYNVKNI